MLDINDSRIFSKRTCAIPTMRRLKAAFFCVFVLQGWPLLAQTPLFPLPQDENEAWVMMREGALDSMSWQMVRPYYEQPLLVPQGELRVLTDIFPGSLSSVPTTGRELSAYEPWREADVQRFFHDFPELVNFRPILSFETAREPYHARIGCSLQKFKNNDPVIVGSFATPPVRTIAIEGRVGFGASSAWWQRRMVQLRTGKLGSVMAGNFHVAMDHGLLYGYFPASTSDTDAGLTWRDGASRTWNGVLYESPSGNHASAAFFYHERQTERTYGGRCVIRSIGPLRVTAGVSRLVIPASDAAGEGLTYAHTEINFSDDHWNAGVIGGCERSNAGAIPFVVYAKHSMKDTAVSESARFEAFYASLPSGCAAPRSALFHECAEKTGIADSLKGDRSIVKTVCAVPLAPWMQSACGASYYHCPGRDAAEGFCSLTGTLWLRYALRYTFRPELDAQPAYHCVTATMSRQAARSVEIRTSFRYINKEETYSSVFARLTASISALPSMEAAPFATVYAASTGDPEFSLGFTQTLRFFDKTLGELKMEVPIVKTFQDQWVIDAKVHFWL
jgi:hypothetical protein